MKCFFPTVGLAIALVGLASPALALPNACLQLFSSIEFHENDTRPLFTQAVVAHRQPSQALRDPLVERARVLHVVEDFKYLADLSPRDLTATQKDYIAKEGARLRATEGEKASVAYQVDALYEKKTELMPVFDPVLQPRYTINEPKYRPVIEHIESMWSVLTRRTPRETKSSLIPLPHPTLIPGERFNEGYYWDSYFAFKSLLRTGRARIVRGQIENFLYLIKEYGLIPNGTRDYYLSRSQPPLISQMVRVYVEHEMQKGPLSNEMKRWLEFDVRPLIEKDYRNFWMGKNRYDAATGLNHFWDAENTPRPERHGADKEEELGKTYRAVRAAAESGKDFTDADGGEADALAPVSLNAMLFQAENNLAWMASLTGHGDQAAQFTQAAQKRKLAIRQYLWDKTSGVHRDYNLRTKTLSPIITADIFIPLAVGLATPEEAAGVYGKLSVLERKGGIMASEKKSGKQWDAPFGWAPMHHYTIQGLKAYGYAPAAKRIAKKWLNSIAKIHARTGFIIEKIDAETGDLPHEDGDKYPSDRGFLWSNGETLDAAEEAGYQLIPLAAPGAQNATAEYPSHYQKAN